MGVVIWIRQFRQNFASNFENYLGFGWPGWIRSSIWIATLAVLTGLMARELNSNMCDYKWNNIIPNMSVVVGAEMNPPNLTVCIPYYSDVLYTVADWVMNERNRKHNRSIPSKPCHECEGMINNSWDVWRNEKIFLPSYWNTSDVYWDIFTVQLPIAIALVKQVLNSTERATATLLNKDNAHWYQAIVDALYLYISCRFTWDIEFFAGLDSMSGNPVCQVTYTNDGFPLLRDVSDETINQLFGLLLDCIDMYLTLVLDPPVKNVTFTPNLSTGSAFVRIPSLLDEGVPLKDILGFTPLQSTMCFRLPPRTVYMMVVYGQFSPDYYRPWATQNKRSVQGNFMVYEEATLYNLGDPSVTLFTSTNTVDETGSRALKLTYNLQTYMDVRGQGITCSKDNIPMDCKAKIELMAAVEHCRCVPFIHRHMQGNGTNLPYCNERSYEHCMALNRILTDSKYSTCTKRCEYTDYKFWESSRVGPDVSFSLSLTPANGSSLKIDFTYKTTFAQFMSQIGGTLNLYLGLSGFTVCAVLFFLIGRAKRCFQRGDNSNPSFDQHVPILGFQTLWFIRALQTAVKHDANIGDKRAKPDEDTIMKKLEMLADRFDLLEGKLGQQEVKTTTITNNLEDTIMKKLEILAERLDALEGKRRQPAVNTTTIITTKL